MATNKVEFNELMFLTPNFSEDAKQAQRKHFLNFITQWLSLYQNSGVNLEKFFLRISDPQSCREIVERCLAFASSHPNVKELRLDFSDSKWVENSIEEEHDALFNLPPNIYPLIGSSLESLMLFSCDFSLSDLLLNFNALKDVSLGWIEVRIETLRTLLSTCKTIENLSLKKCWNLKNFNLGDEPILGLKRLVIDKCHIEQTEYFRFDTPNLEYFKYYGEVPRIPPRIDLQRHVMDEADIDFACFETEFIDEFGDEICRLLVELFPVRVLRVCSYVLQTIDTTYDHPISIQQCDMNVQHLILKTQLHPHELFGFLFLLYSFDKLEKITLEIAPQFILPDYEPPDPINLKKFWAQYRVYRAVEPECMVKKLKVVEIKGCRGSEDEIKACIFFIQKAEVLEALNIKLLREDGGYAEMGRRLEQQLNSIPKSSRNLRISVM